MTDTALVGLVGGLGPAATVHYYRALLAECEKRKSTLRLLIDQANVDLMLDAAARGAVDEMADHLSERMRELERAGADVLAIAAVTPHMCMEQLVCRLQKPVVDIVDALNLELQRQSIGRIVLMGTRQTVASRLFGRVEAEVVDLAPSQVSRCHELYLSIVRTARVSDEVAGALAALAAELQHQYAPQAIVLAGTELALVPKDAWSGSNAIDCAELHVQAIVAAARPA